MIFGRYDTYENHLATSIPRWFDCAQCRGVLSIWVAEGGCWDVHCAAHPEHQGFVKRETDPAEAEHNERLRALVAAARKLSPAVDTLVQEQRRKTREELYGKESDDG